MGGEWPTNYIQYTIHGVELGQVSCGKQTFGCEFNVIKVVCILFFVRLVLEPKSKRSQSIPKIFRYVKNYRQMFVYRA